VRIVAYFLAELDRLPAWQRFPIYVNNSSHDTAQVLNDPPFSGRSLSPQPPEDAGDIRPIPPKQIPGLGFLRAPHRVRTYVVDSYSRKAVEYRAENVDTGSRRQQQSIGNSRRHDSLCGIDEFTVAHIEGIDSTIGRSYR
jgi:hypothetical protein